MTIQRLSWMVSAVPQEPQLNFRITILKSVLDGVGVSGSFREESSIRSRKVKDTNIQNHF